MIVKGSKVVVKDLIQCSSYLSFKFRRCIQDVIIRMLQL